MAPGLEHGFPRMTDSDSDLIYGRLAAWLARNALGETGIGADGRHRNNIGALDFPDLFKG